MATIVNSRDVLLQAAAARLVTVTGPSNETTDFANVTGVTKPADNADVTQSAINGTVTVSGGGITLSGGGSIKGGQSGYDSGTGFFLGYSGGYRFSVGNSAGNKLTWNGSTLGIVGDIAGTSSLNITGSAQFGGAASSGGYTWAVIANGSNGSHGGVLAFTASAYAVRGEASSSGYGVFGLGSTGAGVYGYTSNASGVGVRAENGGGGVALYVAGPMSITTSQLVSNLNAQYWNGVAFVGTSTGGATATFNSTNKPGGASSNSWLQLTNGATTIYIPVWT